VVVSQAHHVDPGVFQVLGIVVRALESVAGGGVGALLGHAFVSEDHPFEVGEGEVGAPEDVCHRRQQFLAVLGRQILGRGIISAQHDVAHADHGNVAGGRHVAGIFVLKLGHASGIEETLDVVGAGVIVIDHHSAGGAVDHFQGLAGVFNHHGHMSDHAGFASGAAEKHQVAGTGVRKRYPPAAGALLPGGAGDEDIVEGKDPLHKTAAVHDGALGIAELVRTAKIEAAGFHHATGYLSVILVAGANRGSHRLDRFDQQDHRHE